MPFVIGVIGTGSRAKKTDYTTLSHAAAVELGKKETADHPVAVAQREAMIGLQKENLTSHTQPNHR